MSSIRQLFVVSDDDVKLILAHYEKTEKSLRGDLEILREWLKKEPHLPQDISDERLKQLLVRNKFRLEQVKKQIEAYYTVRALHKEFYDVEYFRKDSPTFKALREVLYWIPLPYLYQGRRIIVLKLRNNDDNLFNFLHFTSYVQLIHDMSIEYDFHMAVCLICDLSGVNLSHLAKVDVNIAHKTSKIGQLAFSTIFAGMEFINPPPYMEVIMKIMKVLMKPKLFERIRVHTNFESLHDVISKEYLPTELGGTLGSLEDYHQKWGKEIEYQFPWIEKVFKTAADDTQRVGQAPKNELFGTEGSFRKLNLD